MKRERSVSVVELGTLRYAASTAKLTDSRQRDVVTYKPGQIVEFHRTAFGSVRGGVQEKRFQKRRTVGSPPPGGESYHRRKTGRREAIAT
jgi:hypothetical protein